MRTLWFGCLTAAGLSLQTFSTDAQMPSLKTNGNDSGSVYLQKLAVDVVIEGAVATTTWTMTFKNSTGKTLEGNLNFPLPQDVQVSNYALDINGVLREAVPVEKEKATEVFESTERRRIDPGVLEKVDGNTFRTRIYPINPGGVRTVRIGYEQPLSWEGASDLRYRLPLAFSRPIEEFSVHISVPGARQQPGFEENAGDGLAFEAWKESWSASHTWTNYRADRSIAIRIPQAPGAGAVLMQQDGSRYYYAASIFPLQERVEKAAPHRIVLLWDQSLSGLRRDRKKEFELLDAYFGRLGDAAVQLVPFSNAVGDVRTFSVHNGDWQSLKKALEETVYDGGTQFGALRLHDYPCDAFLLFSDGHSTFGSSGPGPVDHPLYAVASVAGADYPFLRSLTGPSGGELIDLEEVSIPKACSLLCDQSLQFLGVRPAQGLEESYPSQPTTVSGGFTVTGICRLPAQEIVLQFGYGGKVMREEKVVLDYPRQQAAGIDVARVWAEKKIAELDMRYDENQEEIRRLGRRFGLVTRNTSLVVLENVMDYVNNGIEPPVDLREAYDRILKGREQDYRQQQDRVTDRAEQYLDELLRWWRGEAIASTAGALATVSPGASATAPSSAVFDEPRISSSAAPPLGSATPLAGRVAGVSVRGRAEMQDVVVVGYASRKRRAVGTSEEKDAEEDFRAGPAPVSGSFTILKADVNTAYLQELRAAAPKDRYSLYLRLRKGYPNVPMFYFHTSELFFAAGDKVTGLRILSNIAELETENYELYKLMGYKLKEAGDAEAACATFRKVLEWRPFEPQSYRDYGLALEDAGHYQRALDTLYLALTKNYDANIEGLYPGIEETLLPEINELIALHGTGLNKGALPKKLVADLPVDMRVVLNWNQNNTDIDLWVTDPDNERCFYGHRFTAMGGRISHDFTRGLGPEQFLLKKAAHGVYKVEVNYFGDTQVKLAGETTLLVEVYTHYGTARENRSLVTLQLKPGSRGASYVGEFEF
jgi:Ca-activated chloride channel homolog